MAVPSTLAPMLLFPWASRTAPWPAPTRPSGHGGDRGGDCCIPMTTSEPVLGRGLWTKAWRITEGHAEGNREPRSSQNVEVVACHCVRSSSRRCRCGGSPAGRSDRLGLMLRRWQMELKVGVYGLSTTTDSRPVSNRTSAKGSPMSWMTVSVLELM
uniref:Secreted protein n=1 Tax=Panagrellus redivivus TaxID=6233 RepID=A0A7E4VQQ7_PANRE